MSSARPSRRLRIGWLSPLPPDRTDIGHYTARILRHLLERMNVELWTATREPDPELARLVPIRRLDRHALPVREMNAYDALFYHLGNNPHFHVDIQYAAWRVPGIVVCHDADLHHLLLHIRDRVEQAPERYVLDMATAWGEKGRDLARRRLAGVWREEEIAGMPLLAPSLAGCLGAVCHTERAEEIVRRAEVPVLRLPLPYGLGPRPRRSARSGPLLLTQFGYLGPNRRVPEVLAALAAFPRRSDIRLRIYGEIWDPDFIRSEIERRGLAGIVSLAGFVKESELDAALAASDLVLNLRFPTFGEASGSQLRIWHAGVPSVVTSTGWFATLEDDVALKIPPGEETPGLHRLWSALLEDRTRFDSVGLAGRERLERCHAPSRYADAILDAAKEAGGLRRRLGALRMMRRVGETLRGSPSRLADAAIRHGTLTRMAAFLSGEG